MIKQANGCSQGMHWIYPSVGGALFGFGLGSIGDAVLTLVIDSYPEVNLFSSFPFLSGPH